MLCGAPASARCSACASKSGVDLWSCSAEHQERVSTKPLDFRCRRLLLTLTPSPQAWPAHKILCGERANPARIPAFSQKEADLAWRRYNQTPAVDSQAEIQEQLKMMCELGTGKDVKVGKAVASRSIRGGFR